MAFKVRQSIRSRGVHINREAIAAWVRDDLRYQA